MGVAVVTDADSPREITDNGNPLQTQIEQDGDLRTHLGYTVLPNSRSKRIRAGIETKQAMEGDGNIRVYRLRLLNQPTLEAGRYYVRINVAPGWQVDRRMFDGIQTKDEVIEVRLTRPWWRGLFG
jgi:hypothetical protein